MRRARRRTAGWAVVALAAAAVITEAGTSQAGRQGRSTTTELYDTFSAPGGYTLEDYAEKWGNPYGPGEMALEDTRTFTGGRFGVSAAPYRTAADVSVFDHLKYIGISTRSFPVPERGFIEISSTIRAETPGRSRAGWSAAPT